MAVGVSFHAAGTVENVTDGTCGLADGIDGGGARCWLQWFIGEHFVVHWRNMNTIFFNGIGAGWALLAVGIRFQAFGLLDDAAHFTEETDDVMFDDGGSMLECRFILRFAKSVDSKF